MAEAVAQEMAAAVARSMAEQRVRLYLQRNMRIQIDDLAIVANAGERSRLHGDGDGASIFSDGTDEGCRTFQGEEDCGMGDEYLNDCLDINKHRYLISINAGREEFEALMIKRQGRMLDICSTTVDGMPVTPPVLAFLVGQVVPPEDKHTFHIVELDNPGDPMCVQLLFRETDLYFVAFRPLDRDNDDPESANGWFHFKEQEAIIPSFLNSHEIYYSYGYNDVSKYRVGTGCLPDIYFCLRQYTPANARLPSVQRKRALMVSCLMLAETQRFMQIQREVIDNIHANAEAQHIAHLDGLIHDWGKESRRRLSAADHHPHGDGEQMLVAPAAPAQVVDYGLWVLKYDADYALPLIMRQQQQHPLPPLPPLPPRQQKQQLRRRLLQLRLRQLRRQHHRQQAV